MDKQEIREVYDDLAPWYDLLEGIPDRLLGGRELRRAVVGRARGRVLEVAVGTGRNLPFYPPRCTVVGVDVSAGMLRRAAGRSRRRDRRLLPARMDAEALGFSDATFDTVVDSMALCTFTDPTGALREMARVCRPDGRILLVEHGRSDRETVGRFQDRHEHWLAERVGCHWNREPVELADAAGLEIGDVRRTSLGIFQGIVARPPPTRAQPRFSASATSST